MELTVLGCSGSYGAPGRRRVQRLPAAHGDDVDLDGLRQRDVRPPAGAHRRRGPHRGRAHARAPRPLRRHLRAPRPAALRARSRGPSGVRAGGPREEPAAVVERLGRRLRLARDRRRRPHANVGDIDLAFSRTDHPPPTYAVEASGRRSRLVYTADTGPDWTVGAFAPGADLVLSEASYLHDDIPAPIHLSARQAGTAAREAKAQRLILTHLWPRIDPAACARGRRRRLRRTRSRWPRRTDHHG